MASSDARLLLLAPEDNCLAVTHQLSAGETVLVEGEAIILPHAIAMGHKLARVPLNAGTQVFKYGAPIGRTTCAVARGEHLHLHNLASEHIASTAQVAP
jgi:altronate dehydratase small subunit